MSASFKPVWLFAPWRLGGIPTFQIGSNTTVVDGSFREVWRNPSEKNTVTVHGGGLVGRGPATCYFFSLGAGGFAASTQRKRRFSGA